MASTSNKKSGSRNGLTKGARGGSSGLDLESWMRLDFTVELARIKRPKMRNASTRIVHANPSFGMRRSTMMGKMTPPIEAPEETIPNAVERRLANHVLTAPVDE